MITRSKAVKEHNLVDDNFIHIDAEPDFFTDLDFQRKLTIWLKMRMGMSS